MRRLIADIYKILYALTGYKFISFVIALVYITALNLLTIYGLSTLLTGALPFAGTIQKLFNFPVILITGFAVLSINYWLMLPLENLSKERGAKIMYLPIIIYTVISAILFAYTLYNKIDPLILN